MDAQILPDRLAGWQQQSPRSHHARAAHSVTGRGKGIGEKAEAAIEDAA